MLTNKSYDITNYIRTTKNFYKRFDFTFDQQTFWLLTAYFQNKKICKFWKNET